MILGKKVNIKDLEAVDYELYKGLNWMLWVIQLCIIVWKLSILFSENDITDILEESFSTTEDRFGELVTIELKPDGENLTVTEENKQEYVDLLVEYRIVKRVQEQFAAFLEGFGEAIPLDLIRVFDENELELLIGGVSEIDMCVYYRINCTRVLTSFQGRLDQIHGLPRVRENRSGHRVVLAVLAFLACRA
jgi:E3 ubiquitin-protein ligase NEDD4